ncbi:hypothetical protein ASG87_10425 [Frateuria sp. Soil773]|uniref:DUF2884 family protein n=1 Tax=Frateuria sp. Soil773 TaxID=1736407 RepID=UPI0006FF4024|nr:DUF2884 family protein [Frateuria sp. Soil773]KRF01912.1 hypothetical protein ASG87_10425 [Frateuria sp. Soil773]
MHRNLKTIASALVLGMGMAAGLQAHELRIHHDQCGFDTDYDVRVTAAGVAFDRAGGEPASVFMHDGALRVDGRDVAVSDADAARLRDYESQVRALLPEVAGIAREGVDIGFSAMSSVVATFAENPEERSRLVGKMSLRHRQALARIDQGIGSGVWKRHAMDDVVEDGIGDTVSELVGTVTASAVKAALSGDESKVQALEARADSLDKSIDREVDARADALEKRADALCPRLARLDQLQRQFQFRLGDGSPLQLLHHESAPPEKASKEVASR